MSIFQNLDITASALTAQRLRMDVVSSNMANVDTTRARFVNGQWEPYRRKLVVMEPRQEGFSTYLQAAMNGRASVGDGVQVAKIVEDQTPFKLVYDPSHPDADRNGYVRLPNVDPLKEMVDLMSATRSYEANVTVFNATKGMLMKALEIGK
ncbi:flagellar basal body rod protein FlgC [Parageobacillus thermoglucosidasius]|jgi:flagellar basal-body rod protein FlgC|uniref:Flagellar basal-body rod protein FlgC n=1 Tax=Parageobacillus thermoglucosidasius TaxID=1426 RepID=A0A1B7KTJ4_PARTM|nr:flagellar basal body rod protein FlgC [Parageobacillus thermoglucosidasius]OAT73376.1 flagellar basal body rod protein FlgC [Parageobacillus thermoglucosidasius]